MAGRAGGRRIAVPPGRGTRPTSERVREALFSTLDTLIEIAGSSVVDLYAGSGAIGLEALSRGASQVLFVESDPRAAGTIRDNLRALGLPGGQVRVDRVPRAVATGPPAGPYRVVFADPPYALADVEVDAVLASLVAHAWLAPEAVVVLERRHGSGPPVWPTPLTGVKERRYGDAVLRYGLAP